MKLPTLTQSATLRLYLPYFVLAVGLTTLIHIAVQQDYRQTANDPQVQMAEDAAAALDHGTAPESLVPAIKVDQRTSLAPFLIITDENRNVVASSVQLDGKVVLPPAGAFDVARNGVGKNTTTNHENRITWQPTGDVRDATIIIYHDGAHPGYVIAGRSLREIEARESNLTLISAAVLLGILVAGFILLLILR